MSEKLDNALNVVRLLKGDEQNNITGSKYGLATGLDTLRFVQSNTSALAPNCIPDGNQTATADQLRTYFLALIIELGELVQELNWKPWKESKSINKERVADEFADVLAFLGIILEYLDRMGVSPQDIAEQYAVKTEVNVNRFLGNVEGYKLDKEIK